MTLILVVNFQCDNKSMIQEGKLEKQVLTKTQISAPQIQYQESGRYIRVVENLQITFCEKEELWKVCKEIENKKIIQ